MNWVSVMASHTEALMRCQNGRTSLAGCAPAGRLCKKVLILQDPKKFARGMQLLQMNEEIKTAKKVGAMLQLDAPCSQGVGCPISAHARAPDFPFLSWRIEKNGGPSTAAPWIFS